MPTYEYVCERCGHRFERFQSMSDKAVERCEECEGPVRRIISGGAAAIVKNPSAGSSSSCGQSRPCCGRETRCDERPCEQ